MSKVTHAIMTSLASHLGVVIGLIVMLAIAGMV
jgi:hypothetical protein